MLRTSILAIAAVAAMMSFTSYASAEENAITSEAPAALQALGLEDDLVLSNDEADSVRGTAFIGILDFDVAGPGFTSSTTFAFSGVNSISVIASPTPGTFFGIGNTNVALLLQ